MSKFDLDTYFANRDARVLGSTPEAGIPHLLNKQEEVAQASAEKVRGLEAIQERLRRNREESFAGQLGLDPDEGVGSWINQGAANLSGLSDVLGSVADTATDSYAGLQESVVDAAAQEAFVRQQQGVATPADLELLAQRPFVPGGGDMSNQERLEHAMSVRKSGEAFKEKVNLDSLVAAQADGTKPSSVQRTLLGDTAVSLLKSAVGVPEAAVGIADIFTLGHAGKLLEEAGFQPGEAKAFLDTLYSHEQRLANASVAEQEGFWNTLSELADNPSTAGHALIESLFPMLAGGVAAKGLKLLGLGVRSSAAAGEGAVMAGSAAERIRQQTDDGLLTTKQAGTAVGTGLVGSLIARVGASAGNRLGVGDIDEAIAGAAASQVRNPVARGVVAGALEGAEETAQSAEETIFENVALDRQWDEGVGNAAAMGLVTGAAMGSGMSLAGGSPAKAEKAPVGEFSKQARDLLESSKNAADAAVSKENLGKVSQLQESLQKQIQDQEAQLESLRSPDMKAAESTLARYQALLENTDPADTARVALIERNIQATSETLAQYEAGYQEKAAPIQKQLEKLTKELDSVAEAKNSIAQLAAPELADIPAQVELADSTPDATSPEAVTASRAAAERIVSLAMASPESLSVENATRLADNSSNTLTDKERAVLRSFAKAKATAHALKGLEGVTTDIFRGNKKEGFKGLNEYNQDVTRALNLPTPDMKRAEAAVRGLEKFAASRKAKYAVAKKAFEKVVATPKKEQWVLQKNGEWAPASRNFTWNELNEVGGMEIHGGSGALVDRIGLETEAVQAALDSLKAMIAFKTPETAPVQQAAAKTEPKAEVEAKPAAKKQIKETVDSAPTVEEEPVQAPENTVTEEKPKTGELKVYRREETEDESVPAGERFKKSNLVKKYTKQQSGQREASGVNPAEAGRPLVIVHDFISELEQSPDLLSDFLPEDFLTESPERAGVIPQFIRLVKEWGPRIQESLSLQEKDKDFRFDDPFSFFIEQDEQGNLSIDENLATAMVASAATWIAEEVAKGLYADNKAINGTLGREDKHPVTPKESAFFSDKGTRANLVINSLGQRAIQALGLKVSKDAPKNFKATLEASVGTHILGLLIDQGVVERSVFTGKELAEHVSTELTQDFLSISHPFVRLARTKAGKPAFSEKVEQIHSMQRGTGNLLAKMFGVDGGLQEPSRKPFKFSQKSPNNTNQAVPGTLDSILKDDVKQPYSVRLDMHQIVTKMSRSTLEKMAGILDENVLIPKALRNGLRAKNEGLRRDISNALALFENLLETDSMDSPLYMLRSVWKHHRVGMEGNVLNPQASKVHRHLVAMQAWRQTIDVNTDAALVEQFKLGVMEALGEKTDKQPNELTVQKFDAWIQTPETQEVLAILQDMFDGGLQTAEQEEKLAKAVEKGGEKLFTLDALVSAAAYDLATKGFMGGKFETNFFREVDGKTNGAMLAHLQLSPFESEQEAFEFLNRGGFYAEGGAYQHYSQFRGDAAAGNLDLYESTARLVHRAVQKAIQANEGLKESFAAAFRITGPLATDAGEITKFGRNLVKQPDTAVVYGAGLNGTVNNMASSFIEKTYERLMAIANGKGKGDTLEQYLADVNTLLKMGGAKPLATNMTLEQVLEVEFSTNQEKALRVMYQKLLGEPVTEAMKEQFGSFMAARDTLNQGAQLAFELYEAAYQGMRQAKMAELVQSGDMAVDQNGNPIHDLSQAQEEEIRNELSDMLPAAHSLFSKPSNDLKEAILMTKSERSLGGWRPYKGTAKFGFGVFSDTNQKGKASKSMNFTAFERRDTNPGVAALVLLTQSADSAISARAYAKLAALNVHDAHILGLKDVLEGGKNLNQATFEVMTEFSIAGEIDAMVERVVTGFAERVASGKIQPDEQSLANAMNVLDRRFSRLSKEEKKALKDPLTTFLNELRATRLKADQMRLSVLSKMAWVDQYSLEGGSYQVTEKDKEKIAEQQKALQSVAQSINNPNIAQIEQLLQDTRKKKEPSAEAEQASNELDNVQLPAQERNAWGELGKSVIEHDQKLVQFFENTPEASFKDVLKALRTSIEGMSDARYREYYRELWKALVKNVSPNLKVVYVTENTPMPEGVEEKMAQSARGFYSFGNNSDTIYIKGPMFRRSGITAELLLHELVHSVVARTIDMAEQGNPLEGTQDLVTELNTLLERAREYAEKNGLSGKYVNALANVQEFVAWGMTNEGFQRNVLSQFTIQSKTTRNALVKGMEWFTNLVRDILYRGSSKSNQKIQVSGLKTLFANVSGLMSTAEQARQVATGQTRSLAMADPITEMEVEDLFDGLEDPSTSLDRGFQAHLRSLLESAVRPLHGPFGVIRTEAQDNQALSAQDVLMKALAEGKAPFAAQLRGPIKITDQEAFMAEQIEVSVRTALETKDRSASLVYRELKSLYNEIAGAFRNSDSAFFDGDWNTATPEQKEEAKALREFFLEIPEGQDMSNYLSRFAALGLTNQTLYKLLDRPTARDTRNLGEMGWAERLQTLVERLMKFLAGKITHTWAGQQGNEKLRTLVEELVDIEAKYRRKMAQPKNKWLEQAENLLADTTEKGREMLTKVAESQKVANSKHAAVRALGSITSAIGNDRVEHVMDAGKQLRDRIFKGRQGFIASMVSEMRGVSYSMLELIHMAKHNEQQRKNLITWTSQTVIESFANKGKDLTTQQKDAMALLLRADLSSLLNQGYTLQQLKDLVSPSDALAITVAELEKQVLTSKHGSMYLRRAKALGKFLVTGKATIDQMMLNANNIARMYGTSEANRVAETEVARVMPLIDQLVSLYALQAADVKTKEMIADVMAIEQQRTDGGNGVEFTLKLHASLQDEARKSLFEGSDALFMKGYTPEIHNPYTEVVAATAAEGAQLEREGWERVSEELQQDVDDLRKEPKFLYVLNNRGMQARLTGALSFTRERAKGSQRHSGLVSSITGNSMVNNLQITQRLDHLKRTRESLALSKGVAPQGTHMVPVLNSAGEVVNYRYMMSSRVRDNVLERTNAFDKLLGTLHGNTFDKQASKEQNAKVVSVLHDQWKEDGLKNQDAYIMVGPDSKDEKAAEAWRLLSRDTQEEIRKVWGTNNMFVRNDQLDLIIGYRKHSLADMFEKGAWTRGNQKAANQVIEDQRTMMEEAFVWLLKDVFQLGDKAALRVRQAEDIWQAIVQEVKDIVVIRSGVTLFWNVVSNMTLLVWQGVPVKDILRNHWVAWQGAVNYRKDSEELFRLEAELSTGTARDVKGTQQRVRQLRDAMARNPAKELIDAGMLPTIVEDVAIDDDPYSYRSQLKKLTDKYTQWVPKQVKEGAATVYMSPGTTLHNMLSHATQYSDFVARYTLYQHLTTKKNGAKSKQEAMKIISDSFVNYDVPSGQMMQYMNDMGLLMFTKYYLRIQRVIMNNFREHPARAMMLLTLDAYMQGMQSIVDSSMWTRLGNPLEWGALQYPGSLDELGTIQAMTAIFK